MYDGVKRKVLIVEDNEINREMLREIMSEQYYVLEAADGAEGAQMLREHFRDLSLILLDVQMPRMDGYAFLKWQHADPLFSGVPVIVTTGSQISEDEERCLALGASDFVTKPYNPRVILRRAEAIIRLRESIAALEAVEHDPVTGLYTKRAFYHHGQSRLDRVQTVIDMLMINIEDFSYINERYGETVGDALLRHIGQCILTAEEETVISCRYHADRFILMRERRQISPDHETEAAQFDSTVHSGAPIRDFTVKYAIYENVDTTVPISVLCDRLAVAMKTVKKQYGRRLAYYDATMSEKMDRLHRIEQSMTKALAEGQFLVYYQPKHDAFTGQIAGAEALVRWVHPEYGFLSPGEFIPLFEENGFITHLDLYVWQTVCRDLGEWQAAGLSIVPVSVNASRRDFVSVDDAEKIMAPIRDNGLDEQFLHMEITESLGIGDEAVVQKVKAVRGKGICIELDDFGTGHSALGSLRDIPMDVIKLDISFVRSLEKQKEIVQMIISLAHALGLPTVAEGVETEEQINILRAFGCDLFQGYYYSKPLPAEEFRRYLREHTEVLS